ncbi:MAG TPA: hypothetical protein VD864_00815 [Nocardioides sp.]|nr:hypothetical protein [Nocardioides sp.]
MTTHSNKLLLNDLADTHVFVEGRSTDKAVELLAAAKKAGLPAGAVITTGHGYIVPKELVGDGEQVAEQGNAQAEQPVPPSEETGAEAFDPSKHTVEEVEAYLATADEAERERVIAAEAEGKARKSIANLAEIEEK